MISVGALSTGCGGPTPPAASPVAVAPSPGPVEPPIAPVAEKAALLVTEAPPTEPPKARALSEEELIARQTEFHVRELERRMASEMMPPPAGRVVPIAPDGHVAAPAAVPQAPAAAAVTRALPALTAPTSPSVAAAVPPAVIFSSPAQEANAAVSIDAKPEPAAVPRNFPPAAPAPTISPADSTLAQRAKENARDLPTQLDYQLSLFTRDEPVPHPGDLSGLLEEDREIMTTLLDGLTNFRSGIRNDGNMLMGKKIRPLIDMSERLRSRADLSIPTALLCKNVKSYGQYEAFEPARFPARSRQQAALYAEVENFSAQLNDKNLWTISLNVELVLYTEAGQEVWRQKSSPVTDSSRNRRRDFYVGRIIDFPDQFTIGRYVLKVTITDNNVSRIAESSIPIQFYAPNEAPPAPAAAATPPRVGPVGPPRPSPATAR